MDKNDATEEEEQGGHIVRCWRREFTQVYNCQRRKKFDFPTILFLFFVRLLFVSKFFKVFLKLISSDFPRDAHSSKTAYFLSFYYCITACTATLDIHHQHHIVYISQKLDVNLDVQKQNQERMHYPKLH